MKVFPSLLVGEPQRQLWLLEVGGEAGAKGPNHASGLQASVQDSFSGPRIKEEDINQEDDQPFAVCDPHHS